jgi:hypothetical protein
MIKVIKILLCFIVVDFFFFSTPLAFTYGYNTKELMAVVGIFLFINDLYRQKAPAVPRAFLGLIIFSVFISIIALFSTVYHNTSEHYYTTYFLSMLVWLSAAFVVIKCIKGVHGKVTVELLAAYIIAVSVTQGLIAVIADNYEPLDNLLLKAVPGMAWCKTVDRIYGFGVSTALDTGGIRYAAASILCAHLIRRNVLENKPRTIPIILLAFLILTFTGNMIARTTLVGTVLGLAFLLISLFPSRSTLNRSMLNAWGWLIVEVLIVVTIIVAFYNTDAKFRSRTRFAFEGFFSMAEEGRWRTGSNDKLLSMYVFPETIETWIIGDGYFGNPADDLNYLGKITEGYYQNTDVGYLRFIYYFGLIGLLVFSLFILYSGWIGYRSLPEASLLIVLLTSLNFIIWFKVATDCFFILGLFICLVYVKNSMEEVSPPELEGPAQ